MNGGKIFCIIKTMNSKRFSLFLACVLMLIFIVPGFAQTDAEVCAPDSFFPEAGNCGYEIEHYEIIFEWDQPTNLLSGDVTLTVNFTDDLELLSLDFSNKKIVNEVSVNGLPAEFAHVEDNIDIPGTFSAGDQIKVRVIYSGLAEEIMILSSELMSRKGATDPFCIVSEPTLAHTWFPSNDTPRDRATFDITVTVPAKYAVGSNGRLQQIAFSDGTTFMPEGDFSFVHPDNASGSVTYSYKAEAPMPPYLMTVCLGEFEIYGKMQPDSIYQLDFIDQNLRSKDQFKNWADMMPEMIQCFEPWLGDYPFADSGSIVINRSFGGALETQTRSVYGSDMLLAGADGFSHELSHQWIGNLVSLNDWSDLWIKEGFATFSEALWIKCSEGQEAFEKRIQDAYETIALMTLRNRKAAVMAQAYLETDEVKNYRFDDLNKVAEALSLFCDREIAVSDLKFPEDQTEVNGTAFWQNVPDYCSLVSIDPLKQQQINELFGLDKTFDIKLTGPKSISNDFMDMYSLLPYDGGSLVYAALYYELGEDVFAQAMRTLVETYRNQSITTQQVIDVFSDAAGSDMNDLINSWLLYRIPPNLSTFKTYREIIEENR
jgi:aminopeptidase N